MHPIISGLWLQTHIPEMPRYVCLQLTLAFLSQLCVCGEREWSSEGKTDQSRGLEHGRGAI